MAKNCLMCPLKMLWLKGTQEWFAVNFDRKDAPPSGQQVIENVDEVLQLVKQDRFTKRIDGRMRRV